MSSLDDGQLELLRVLARHGVDFVVVGGVAAQVHGWRSATLDLDIAVSKDQSNVDRFNAALEVVGVVSSQVGAFGTAFKTRYGRLEVVSRAHAVGRYADWAKHASKHELEDGLIVVVAAPLDILRSKEAAGRDKDLAALPQMRQDFEDAGAL
jgi:hypothetical protein